MDFAEIGEEINKCTKCELYKTRLNAVVGEGNVKSRVLFIGEAPGQTEDETGLPFVGKSGKLLDSLLEHAGLVRERDLFITNILKCRPPKNRDPKQEEQDACIEYLRQQYKLLHPKIVVCLGRIAAHRIIDPSYAVTRQHGTWIEKCGTYFTATFHPSALLRNPNNMKYAEDDFNKIREKLEELCSQSQNR